MNLFTKTIASLIFVSMSANLMSAEIKPDPAVSNSLVDAIVGAQAGDVIILQRGAYYYHQTTIEISVPLTIKADATNPELPKPIVSLLVRTDNTTPTTNFTVKSDLVCENIHFHAGVSGRPGYHDDVRRCMEWSTTANMRAEFRGCIIQDYDARTMVLEAPDMKFFAYDCVWLNDHKTPGPSEGRSIDLRQFGPDSLVIQNSTFVNSGNRWIRHMPSSGVIDPINYAKIDHCTFVNAAGYHPPFDFGTIENLQFTNNIVQNNGIMGTDFTVQSAAVNKLGIIADPANYNSTDKKLMPYRVSEVYYDRADGIVILGCHGVDSIGTKITMHNNNIYNIPEIAAKLAQNDTVSPVAVWCTQFKKSIQGDTTKAYSQEAIKFVKGSELVGDGFNWIDSIMNRYIGYWDKNQYFVMPWPNLEDIDFNYGTTAAAYTAGVDGYPLGDLNWYPYYKCKWAGGTNCVDTKTKVYNSDIVSVYPNPASNYLQIKINGNKPATFKMFNLFGNLVYSSKVVNSSSFDLKAANIGQGLYLYTVETEDNYYSGKLIVK